MEALFSLWIPDFDCVVVSSADHKPAIILYTAYSSHVTNQDVKALACIYVPDPQRGVTRPTNNSVKIKLAPFVSISYEIHGILYIYLFPCKCMHRTVDVWP